MISDQRLDEVIDKFGDMPEAEFEQWMNEQPDADELGKALVNLFLTGDPEKNKAKKGDTNATKS